MVGNSSVPTKVSKNISTDLQSQMAKRPRAPKRYRVEKKVMNMFF